MHVNMDDLHAEVAHLAHFVSKPEEHVGKLDQGVNFEAAVGEVCKAHGCSAVIRAAFRIWYRCKSIPPGQPVPRVCAAQVGV